VEKLDKVTVELSMLCCDVLDTIGLGDEKLGKRFICVELFLVWLIAET